MLLITGTTGLLGSHVLLYILYQQNNYKHIRAIIRNKNDISKIKSIFSYYKVKDIDENLNKVEWIEADIRDYCAMEKSLIGVKEIYHCAAKVSFENKHENEIMDVNVGAITNLLNLSLEKGVKKFCYVGSVSSLSYSKKNKNQLIDENSFFDNLDYNSIYAKSKYESKMEAIRAYNEGMNVVIVLPSIILGPTYPGKGVMKIIDYIYKNPYFYTKGGFGFVDVNDLVKIMFKLMRENKFGNIYIVSSENLTYKEVILKVLHKLNRKKKLYKASSNLVKVIYKLDNIITNITFGLKKPILNKSISLASISENYFSNKKLIDDTNFVFKPIEQSIEQICQIYKDNFIKK